MQVDIACVGFRTCDGRFSHSLSTQRMVRSIQKTLRLVSKAAPGMPLQVLCYERADDPRPRASVAL